MNYAYIINGLRTFIGLKDKALKNHSAENLGALVLSELNQKNKKFNIFPDFVISGNALAGGGNVSRLSSLKAGFPDSVPALTIDAQCTSALESIIISAARISSGINKIVYAGGTESTSTQCVRSWNPNHPNFNPCSENHYTSAQFIPDFYGDNVMFLGADETCRKNHITNDQMIPFVLESHKKALIARKELKLSSVTLNTSGLTQDQSIKENLSENLLKRIPPVLKNGIITSATSCLLQDGASYVTCTDEVTAFKAKLEGESIFKIRNMVTCGGNRFTSPESLFAAIDSVVVQSGLNINQIDRIDYNQAFACIDVLYEKKYSNPSNCYGGALAYGHPFGATGAIIVLHLITALEENNERFGIAALPAAGGISSAVLLERVK